MTIDEFNKIKSLILSNTNISEDEKIDSICELKRVLRDKENSYYNSFYSAGARPFIIWICGFSILYSFIVQPIIVMIIDVSNIPILNVESLIALVTSMIGIGAMRSFDKKVRLDNES